MVRNKKSKSVEGKIQHMKRRQIEDEDGWTHIIDTPKSKAHNANKTTPKPTQFHAGDFEIDGVSYINRTLEEMKADFSHWKQAWEGSEACTTLKQKLEEMEITGVGMGIEGIENAVVLGLGSLQSSRREGRRASATQLAALQTITTTTTTNSRALQVVLQDPQYTELDRDFLSSLGYKVVNDPEAFSEIRSGSLVFAIHCYGPVYKGISEGPRPAVLIGTDVENFGRFDGSNPGIKESLEEMVKGCQVLDFPQVRHDFSDTKIYWRKGETSKPEDLKVEGETLKP